MIKQTPPKRVLFMHSLAPLMLGLLGVTFLLYTSFMLPTSKVSAATDSTINFQARLLTNTGSIVADGTYNVEFKLYKSLAAGASAQGVCVGGGTDDCQWLETLTGANKVTVKNGYLTVNLGSVTGFSGTLNWDQDLYMTMNIGGTGAPSWDGEMTPRIHMTAVPYAFRAGALASLSGANTAILQFAGSIGQNTTITLPDPGAGTATVCYQTASACGFATGTGVALLQGGNTFSGSTAADVGTINNGSLNFRTNNGIRLTLDTTGNLQFQQASSISNLAAASGTQLTLKGGDANSGTNAGGNLLLEGGAGNSTGASGSVIVKSNTNNSANAFQVQNAIGATILSAGTTDTNSTVTNASFEDATITTAWAKHLGSETLTRVTTSPYIGSADASLAMTLTNEGIKQTVTLAAQQWTFSGYFRISSGAVATGSVVFGYARDGSTETDCVATTSPALSSTAWTRYSCTLTTLSTSGTPYFYIRQNTAQTNTLLIDGVQIDSGSSALAFGTGTLSLNGIINSPLTLQNQTDSSTAFQIQNAAGNSAFTVDTLPISASVNGHVALGTTTSNAHFLVSGGFSQFTNASVTGTNATLTISSTFTSSSGNTNTSYSNVVTNNPTTLANTAVAQNVSLTDATTLTNNLQGMNISVSDTGSGAKTVRGLFVDTSGTTNGSAAVTTALFKSASSTSAFQVQNASAQNLLNVDTSGSIVNIGATNGLALATTVNIANSNAAGTAQVVSIGSAANSSSTLTLEAGTGTTALFNGATNHTIQLATSGSAVETVTIGSTNSSSALTLQAGSSNLALSTGSTTGNITLTTNNASAGVIIKDSTASTAAFQVQNAAGTKSVLTVDTSGGSVVLGAAGTSGIQGSLVFNNNASGATHTATLLAPASDPTASYTLNLPASGASGAQCLASTGPSTTTVTVLTFTACTGGAVTLQNAYTSSTGGTTPEILLTTAGGAVDIQNKFSGGVSGGNLLAVRNGVSGDLTTGSTVLFSVTDTGTVIDQTTTNSSTAFQVQNAAGSAIFLVDTTSTMANGSQLNYLTYPGFESGSFSNAAAGWNNVSSTLTQNTNKTNTFFGLNSASVVSAGANDGLTTSSFISAPPSGTYIVSWYAKISSGSMAGNLFTVQTTDSGTHTCSPAASPSVVSTGFTRFSCSIAPTAAVTAFQIIQTSGANTIYYDAIQLQSNSFNGTTITTPSPYSQGSLQLRGIIQNPVNITPNNDSVNVLQVTSAASATVFNVDTLNNQVTLGTGTGANATVLVLGNKTDSGDPGTCTPGAIYYNSVNNATADTTFRVCRNVRNQVASTNTNTWVNLIAGVDVQDYTATSTWTAPPGISVVMVIACGAGGSGGAGAGAAAPGGRQGGTGGGGGSYITRTYSAADVTPSSPVTVTVAPATTGGTGVAAGNGNAGAQGLASSFGTFVKAPGGGAGAGGQTTAANRSGGSGGSFVTNGNAGVAASINGPDLPANWTVTLPATGQGQIGGGSTTNGLGLPSQYGGGGGGASATAFGAGNNGGDSVTGGGGGGGGGGVTAASPGVAATGGAGGGTGTYSNGGAANANAAGSAGNSTHCGTGGGGGLAVNNATGTAGGLGGNAGGGGGGGGGGTNTGGAGGNGGRGEVWVISW